jgi:Flp pilus assembly protein protease CpaA
MIEIFIIACAISAIAGLWDLKTTEVPDELLAIMIITGISYWLINFSITGDITSLFASLGIGSGLLAAGLLLYAKGQWGGADAYILAGVGYMIPFYKGEFFIIPYIMNFFVISAVYMIAYATIIGLTNKKVFSIFSKDLKSHKKYFALPIAFLLFFACISAYMSSLGYQMKLLPVFEMFIILVLLTVFWRYAKVIEQHVFKRKIPVSKLRTGDVLEEMNWVGLTDRQVARIQKTKRYVVIKEGVRFVPVFFLSLIVTYFLGNVLLAVLEL